MTERLRPRSRAQGLGGSPAVAQRPNGERVVRRIADWPVLQTLAVCAIAGGQTTSPDRKAAGAGAEMPCDEPNVLDFWVGQWDVFSDDGRRIGTNVIERVPGGCAVLENWLGTEGDEGRSLFVFRPALREWTQVWMTASGEWKRKILIDSSPGEVRFQDAATRSGVCLQLDRTTLTELGHSRVRRLVERSRDGGATWQRYFEAVYMRRDDS